MKTLIVYYSRTNRTEKVAEEIHRQLGGDIEKIDCSKYKTGFISYFLAGRDAMKKNKPKIRDLKHNPGEYDLVILGMPLWGWTLCPVLRTFIDKYKWGLRNVAFFATMGGSDPKKVFAEMMELIQKPPRATLGVLQKDADAGNFKDKVTEFIKKLHG